MGLPAPIEHAIGRLLINQKARDSGLLSATPAFASQPSPTFTITSPDCGPSNSHMADLYTGYGADRFPSLTWQPPPDVAEYVLIVEDPDAPIPWPVTHGLFYAIPGNKTAITHADLSVRDVVGKAKHLAGGFRLGKNIRGSVYGGPKPPLGHGVHRYHYTLVALGEPLDAGAMSAVATKKEIAGAMEGKVVGWGVWVGLYERKRGE
ncbi:PEBP-like protein [Mytilinidion resinicola]|uniref:PEBP-like protein n=1 Tax=Mytilinidion resinicola TaxID=574789 RepID=A0A6A6Y9S0_9PEZI|nr:PEBP-like protein [Mytilinidion resinicola]KAF2805369.1 PEBP-like protein [Mytilinidion resinicola]